MLAAEEAPLHPNSPLRSAVVATASDATLAQPGRPGSRGSHQPINQSTNQPINQSTNPPINQSTNPPINQSTNEPVNQSTNGLIETGGAPPSLSPGAA